MGAIVIPVQVHCTDCGALPDEPCRQKNGKSTAPHQARRQAFTSAQENQT